MLFDQIASNKRRTWVLLIAFFALLAIIGAAVGYLWLDSTLGGVIIAFIIANAILDLLPISSGLVIGAGVLACIGIGFIFPDKESK